MSPAVCQDPKLGCRLDGNSVAEKRSEAWESRQKGSVQQRKMKIHCSPGHSGSSQLCFPGFVLPTGGFLPGCQGGGCEVCVCSPCDIPVITVTCRWLTPSMTEATKGLVCCTPKTTCLMCDSQAALPVGGHLESTVAFWYICGFSSPKTAICWSGSISEGERIRSGDMGGHISGQTPVNWSKPVSSNLLNWVHLSSTVPVSAWEGWIQLPSPQSTAAAPSSAFAHLLYHCKWSS